MALLSMQDISLGFGHPPLLDSIKFSIEQGERVCLIGRNGAGKSTLLKIITKEVPPDSGNIVIENNIIVSILNQDVPHDIKGSIYEVIATGLGKKGKLLSEYHKITDRLSTNGNNKDLEALDKIQHEIDQCDGWQLDQNVEKVMTNMGLEATGSFSTLSAGMKRRVLLAKALVCEPHILLLDEPTNHLDIEAILWEEQFFVNYKGALILITHDREFLKKVATRIIEIDRGKIFDFQCDYETFLQRKDSLLIAQENQQSLFDKKMAEEEIWLRKGIKARRTRNEGRVRALEKMRKIRSERREKMGSVLMRAQEAERSGRLVIEAKEVYQSFGDKKIIDNFSSTIVRGDKMGIIGPNGVGKTTLLKLLLGKISPQKGNIRLGSKLEITYFDQLRHDLNLNETVFYNIAEGNDTVTIDGNIRHVIGYLKDFLFTSDRINTPVNVLSGGERIRLLLAKLFTMPSNLLVFDEPTNDLDIETIHLLEKLLIEYSGTVLLVSHDRAFLNNVVTSTLVFEGEGVVKEYIGGYDDWIIQRDKNNNTNTDQAKIKGRNKNSTSTSLKEQKKNQPTKKLSYKKKRMLEALPGIIEKLEAKQKELFELMANPDFYKKEGEKISSIKNQLSTIEIELKQNYKEWELLENKEV